MLVAVKTSQFPTSFENYGNLPFPPQLTLPEMGPATVPASSPLPPNFPGVLISFRQIRSTNSTTYFNCILPSSLFCSFPKMLLPKFHGPDHGLLHGGHRCGLLFPTLF